MSSSSENGKECGEPGQARDRLRGARALWDDPDRVEVPACTVGESRSLVIGRIGEQNWSAVVTYRDDRIRIISVRRSRAEEVSIYGEDES